MAQVSPVQGHQPQYAQQYAQPQQQMQYVQNPQPQQVIIMQQGGSVCGACRRNVQFAVVEEAGCTAVTCCIILCFFTGPFGLLAFCCCKDRSASKNGGCFCAPRARRDTPRPHAFLPSPPHRAHLPVLRR